MRTFPGKKFLRKRKMIMAITMSFLLLLGNGITPYAAQEPFLTDLAEDLKIEELSEEVFLHAEISDVTDRVYQAGGAEISDQPIYLATASLQDQTQRAQIKAEILDALKNRKYSGQNYTDILKLTKYKLSISRDMEDLEDLYAEILNENPGLIYAAPYFTRWSSGGDVLSGISFHYDDSMTEAMVQAYAEKLQTVAALAAPAKTEAEKALILHDYLVQHCCYAKKEYSEGTLKNVPHVYDAYGALINEYAVCNGYALAYKALLAEVGIESRLCTSDQMNHAWNLVKIDGEWYHVDATWDDPVWNREGKSLHTFFLLSDEKMSTQTNVGSTNKHYGWSEKVCKSKKYDDDGYWWRDVESRIVMRGESKYYIKTLSGGRAFQLLMENGGKVTEKKRIETYWNVWGGNAVWTRGYAYLSGQGDYLYFNDKLSLYAWNIGSEELTEIYRYTLGDGYIYGAMVYENGMARLNIDTTPNRTTDSYIVVDLKEKAPTVSADYDNKKVNTTAAMEYSLDGGKNWKACAADMPMSAFGWDGTAKVTVSFRTAGRGGRFASDPIELTLNKAAIPEDGPKVSGSLKGCGDTNEATIIRFYKSGEDTAAYAVSVSGENFSLPGVATGTYIMEVSQPGFVTREYAVAVGSENVALDVQLCRQGDTDMNGTVDIGDHQRLFTYLQGTGDITDAYQLKIADINGDGTIDIGDHQRLFTHLQGTDPL